MRCCVPFCNNTSDNVSEGRDGQRISFHTFPTEVHLRAAWLRALGKQDTLLLEDAVVCSQHFVDDDIYEAEGGLRVIAIGAIPSTVQVCMICLDTDSKQFLMSKHKLLEPYEKLTGHPPCDLGNLTQTLCVQCAPRLINFSRFKDKSLRARALMMDLVEKHELDLQVVKTEDNDDSMSVDEDTGVIYEDEGNDFLDPLKCESTPFQCVLCLDEFVLEQAYMRHMNVHIQNGDWEGEHDTSQERKPHTSVGASSSHSSLISIMENKAADPSLSTRAAQAEVAALSMSVATNDENKVHGTEEADTIQETEKVFEVNNGELENQSSQSTSKINVNINRLKNCVVKLYDIFTHQKVASQKTRKADTACDSQNIASKHSSYQATSQNEALTTTSLNNVINIEQCVTEEKAFTCDICRKMFNRRRVLLKHIKTHTEVKRFTCKTCQYKYNYKSELTRHMMTHTGTKPFSCALCEYKCARKIQLVEHLKTHTGMKPFSCTLCEYKSASNSNLVKHMTTHTGIKPFSCTLCEYKCARKHHLVRHMRTHTGIKTFSCTLCEYKCARNHHLVRHMRTHTGIKPFSCALCEYKSARKIQLVEHMKTHTGMKPFSCTLCEYKSATNSNLVRHMTTHTGIKPFSCALCEYTSARKIQLVEHMTTHTGIKPFSCALCEYKSARKIQLVEHMKTHTGMKPFSCTLCKYKSASNSNLVRHMTTHTGIKPFLCTLCEYKCARKHHLVLHMRTHTGIKPFLCTLCEYKCARKHHLVLHMRTHTGIKPFSCTLCEYKCARKHNLVLHMRTHTGIKPF
ncbi:oocyte zinc finger protein XlCOF6-like isoform X2 [Maniola hyperantus]|uniref:oocyte zinc finger protein XlCOF6-like isoform X2 n=1 Tax=Aphantopus hyperantus TaxID=2795564 RepID=UPI00374905FC